MKLTTIAVLNDEIFAAQFEIDSFEQITPLLIARREAETFYA